ncbi:MAG: ABC transporter permease [Actinomycetota bacterium]|nr:ABC transporter permease [Actinomycetota bacterium]MDH5223499.1 ABC transporter permease [Actinomycetota bacterium]MDH5313149.1 ABC transporter permease [Actinomycetota bacterium]
MTITEAEATTIGTPAERRATRGAWWVVFKQEAVELWVGGRAINLLILYSLLLGLMTFLLATNTELNLIPPKEMVFLTLLNTISFGVFIGMIVGADGISGERERGTLEVLLLTPASRRQLILGKLLASLTPWPAAFLISLPALIVVSQGDEVIGQALFLGATIGTALAIAFAGFGLLVSTWSNANKTSMFICLIVWLLLFMLTQLPGEVQKGDFGYFVQRINPMQATSEFMEKVLVNNRTFWERDEYLRSSVIAVVLVLFLLFVIAAPRLRLDAGRARRLRARWGSLSGMTLTVFLLFVLGAGPAMSLGRQLFQAEGWNLKVSLEETFLEVKTGDEVNFDTLLENNGSEDSPPVIMALNIIKLSGDVVDPEDWSPERTQHVDFVPAADQIRHSWTIEAILKGDYMVYLVAVPEPGEKASSHPISSPGLHLTVGAFQRLNPEGVLPVVIAVPLGVTLALLVLVRLRLRRLGQGVADASEDDDRVT